MVRCDRYGRLPIVISEPSDERQMVCQRRNNAVFPREDAYLRAVRPVLQARRWHAVLVLQFIGANLTLPAVVSCPVLLCLYVPCQREPKVFCCFCSYDSERTCSNLRQASTPLLLLPLPFSSLQPGPSRPIDASSQSAVTSFSERHVNVQPISSASSVQISLFTPRTYCFLPLHLSTSLNLYIVLPRSFLSSHRGHHPLPHYTPFFSPGLQQIIYLSAAIIRYRFELDLPSSH